MNKSAFMEWVDEQLDRDPVFRRQVDEALNEMRIEQDLVALREERQLSQSLLAKMLRVSQPRIAKIESGKMKNLQLKTLVRFATALGGRVRIEIVKTRPAAHMMGVYTRQEERGMGQSKHDEIAKRIAQKEGTSYNKGPGPDVQTPRRVIEVATHESDLKDSKTQLQGFQKPRYLATTSELRSKAKELTKGTKIGVMGPTGRIVKRAGGGARGR